jgi:hypothetical protein
MKTRAPANVVVIGTEPPCPRCDLLLCLVRDVAAEAKRTIRLRHIAFDSQEAVELGLSLRRKIGTAKNVAGAAGLTIDWQAVAALISEKEKPFDGAHRPADNWSQELDDMLRPCQRSAESVNYLMTPILLVDGHVMHHGSVPTRQSIRDWLLGTHGDAGL